MVGTFIRTYGRGCLLPSGTQNGSAPLDFLIVRINFSARTLFSY